MCPLHEDKWSLLDFFLAFGRGAGDAIDVTGIISHVQTRRPRWIRQVLTVGLNTPLVTGKFNLLGDTSLFLKLEDAGTYVIEEDETSGARGRYRIEPFMVLEAQELSDPHHLSRRGKGLD